VLLVPVGLSWTLVTRDKLGLVIAFAGVTLLAVGTPQRRRSDRQLSRCRGTVERADGLNGPMVERFARSPWPHRGDLVAEQKAVRRIVPADEPNDRG
jgi:hypothetical protein